MMLNCKLIATTTAFVLIAAPLASAADPDWESMDWEDRAAALAIAEHVADGTHYQRQVDALREMGWVAESEKVKRDLAMQGVVVN